MGKFIDMTGWKMWEHGIPDSKLTVIRRVEDIVQSNGIHIIQWLCECSCPQHNQIVAPGGHIRSGNTLSCGCLQIQRAKEANKKINLYNLDGEYGILWSTNTNEEVYFDLDKAEEILKHAWYIDAYGYPTTSIDKKGVKMHVFLGKGRHDHHNRNKRDNRFENLIPCTTSDNNKNRTVQSNNTSGFIGVCWIEGRGKWRARVHINKKPKDIGWFNDKHDAIVARLKAEKEYYGEFAPQRHLFEIYRIN